jgi:hypothetical protein
MIECNARDEEQPIAQRAHDTSVAVQGASGVLASSATVRESAYSWRAANGHVREGHTLHTAFAHGLP